MAPRARWIGVAIGLLILGGIIWNVFELDKPTVFYVAKSAVPPATNVAIARSNGPVRAFFGPLSVLLILPDGSLWEWGHVGGSSGKIPVPTRVGTNNDWSQASLASGHYLGIHQDGTLWNWGVPYSISPLRSTPWPVAFPSEPEPVGSESNWVQLAASSAHSAV